MPSAGTFAIYDDADNTKTMRFDVSGVATDSVLVVSIPAGSGLSGSTPGDTMALHGSANTFKQEQTMSDSALGDACLKFDMADVTGGNQIFMTAFDANDATVWSFSLAPGDTAAHDIKFPTATGTVPLLEVTNTWTGSNDFGSGITAGVSVFSSSGSGDNIVIRFNDTDNGHPCVLHVTATNDRDINVPDANGTLALVETSSTIAAAVNATGQTGDIASTDTGVASGKFYRVSYTLMTTSADLTAGTVSASFAYTDDAGSTTTSSSTLVLTALGRTTGSFVLYLASGVLNYSTTHTGIFGTAQYALRVRVEQL